MERLDKIISDSSLLCARLDNLIIDDETDCYEIVKDAHTDELGYYYLHRWSGRALLSSFFNFDEELGFVVERFKKIRMLRLADGLPICPETQNGCRLILLGITNNEGLNRIRNAPDKALEILNENNYLTKSMIRINREETIYRVSDLKIYVPEPFIDRKEYNKRLIALLEYQTKSSIFF